MRNSSFSHWWRRTFKSLCRLANRYRSFDGDVCSLSSYLISCVWKWRVVLSSFPCASLKTNWHHELDGEDDFLGGPVTVSTSYKSLDVCYYRSLLAYHS